ncbi:MAG: hypothetical protein VX223_16415, partial [Myxococcota bacterium]|nr:hypothetical protein [Myxococcota bacterium]
HLRYQTRKDWSTTLPWPVRDRPEVNGLRTTRSLLIVSSALVARGGITPFAAKGSLSVDITNIRTGSCGLAEGSPHIRSPPRLCW